MRKRTQQKTPKNYSFNTASHLIKTAFFIILGGIIYQLYSDILFMMQNLSLFYFSFDELKEVTYLPHGYISYLSRFLLQLCYYPLTGSLLVTFFLWLIQSCTQKIICRTNSIYLYCASFLPPLALFVYLTHRGYDFYFKSESTYAISILWITAVSLLTLVLLLSFLFPTQLKEKKLSQKESGIIIGLLLLFLTATYFTSYKDENLLAYTRIQRLTESQEWKEIVEYVEKNVDTPTRNVAAYYAIALAKTNQISSRLFNIRYEYPESNFNQLENKKAEEAFLYQPAFNFYAGLVHTSYHHLMQYHTLTGQPSIFTLKLMAKCALVNKEWALAEKYLKILEKAPLYRDYARKQLTYIGHFDRVVKNKELAAVINLQPIDNFFEQRLKTPVVLGYYTTLIAGKSKQSLDLALVACLYGKDLKGFMTKVNYLSKSPFLPKTYQEAIVAYALRYNKELLNHYKISPIIKKQTMQIMQEISQHLKDKDEGKAALYKKYRGHYLYYYYYGNKQKKKEQKKETTTQYKIN